MIPKLNKIVDALWTFVSAEALFDLDFKAVVVAYDFFSVSVEDSFAFCPLNSLLSRYEKSHAVSSLEIKSTITVL